MSRTWDPRDREVYAGGPAGRKSLPFIEPESESLDRQPPAKHRAWTNGAKPKLCTDCYLITYDFAAPRSRSTFNCDFTFQK
eukprot:g19961.t1